jgi:hypothetical protein
MACVARPSGHDTAFTGGRTFSKGCERRRGQPASPLAEQSGRFSPACVVLISAIQFCFHIFDPVVLGNRTASERPGGGPGGKRSRALGPSTGVEQATPQSVRYPALTDQGTRPNGCASRCEEYFCSRLSWAVLLFTPQVRLVLPVFRCAFSAHTCLASMRCKRRSNGATSPPSALAGELLAAAAGRTGLNA